MNQTKCERTAEQSSIRATGQKSRTLDEPQIGSRASRALAVLLSCSPAVLLSLCLSHAALAVELRVATFKVDVTPPLGAPLCDALVKPVKEINDPLSARGIVLKADDEAPVVLVAVDWVGIGNEGHDAWRQTIAEACRTQLGRVCVHALHQHDAPGCDFLAESILEKAGLSGAEFDVEFAREAIRRVGEAAHAAISRLEPVTHVGYGKGRVEKVASNRRILGPDGKVLYGRMTATRNPEVRAFPEGTIDPLVRVVSFWNGERPIVVLSYYATHPQSYYGSGSVSADYVGMARDQREAEAEVGLHIHFNGAGGNIGAGKYNDGSHENRPILAGRLADGMKAAWDAQEKLAVADLAFNWATRGIHLPLTERYDESERAEALHNENLPMAQRVRAARDMAWARRAESGHAITLARMRLGPIDVLHLPGELFVEYQLAAQQLQPDRFVCMAAYGDYGPGYIGTYEAYSQGGYETSHVSRVSPRVETVLMDALQQLLR